MKSKLSIDAYYIFLFDNDIRGGSCILDQIDKLNASYIGKATCIGVCDHFSK